MRLRLTMSIAVSVLALTLSAAEAETIDIGIGTQDTTTNTVATGAVVRELHLLEKYLPKSGKYAGVNYNIQWYNFTSGPPLTNGMMANKLQFGTMGDYPLVVNGYTFQSNPDSHSQLISIAAYNIYGAGNAVLVNKDSPYFELKDLLGKVVSVPFGSAAHGMVLKTMQDHGWAPDAISLVNQAPEVGATNLQESKIDGHADFVPFGELFVFRGFARKIFDGVETNSPTFHGTVVRTDFAQKYPEIVVAYLKAMIDANAWIRKDPKAAAEQIEKWTGTDKVVVYMFLGPSGIMTTDPTIKPQLVAHVEDVASVLRKLDRVKDFDVKAWVNDSYIRQTYKDLGLDYDKELASLANYEISGHDSFCNVDITEPRKGGEIWIEGGDIKPYSSTACVLGAYDEFVKANTKIAKAFVFDSLRGIKLFADQAYYVVAKSADKTTVAPYLLKKDATEAATKSGGTVVDFTAAAKLLARGT